MINRMKNIISIIMISLCIFLPFSTNVYAEDNNLSGTIGDDISWRLEKEGETEEYTLTISGKGDVPDFELLTDVPWNNYRNNIVSATIENGITGIGLGFLYKSTSLKTLKLADSVKKIGRNAFYFNTSLTDVDLGNGLVSLGEACFAGCSSLETVHLPASAQTIAKDTFHKCTNLKSINLENVTSIGVTAFRNCSSLISLNLNDAVSDIPEQTFAECTSLVSISIPSSTTSIGRGAFYHCEALEKVSGGENVEVIGELALSGCYALSEFLIGDKVTTIGESAFSGCTSYTFDKIPDSVTSLGSWAFNRTAIKSIEIGSGIKTIPAYCFRDCSALENVIFKEGLVYIRNYAFSNDSNLKEVTIPESVATIGTGAFPSTTTLKLLSDKYTDMGNNSYKTIYTAKTTVYQNYENAFAVLEEVNKIREEKGLNPLTMDVDLMEYAMLRATEATLLFEHLRPTGSLPTGATYENLGRNYTSPKAIVELWMKDDHSVPILDANMKAIGVGAVVNNGYYMWTQEFTGVLKEEAKASSYSNSDKTYEINYSTDVINTVSPTVKSVTLNEGHESDIVSAELGGALLVSESLVYSSSDENVCVVSKDGKITGKAAGSAEITIRLSDQNNSDVLSVKVPVKVNHEWDKDYTIEKEPTCTEDGVKSIHCKHCQATKDSVAIPATGHVNSDPVKENQVEASCSKEGSYDEVIYCSVCKQEISREAKVLPKTEHTWDEGVITKEATEEEAGVKTYTCSVCGETRTEEIPVLEHTHKFTEKVVEPTCTEGGYTVHTCKCGETYKDNEKPALGHSYTSEITKEATCKEEGERTYTCERCEDSYTEKLEKTKDHTWNDGVITKEATEEEAGIKIYTCSVCGETKTEEIPVLEHTHKFTEEVVEPTCTEGGYTVHTCKCGETYKDNEKAALGHSYISKVTKEATCKDEGEKTFTCERCKDSYTEKIEKTKDHTWNEGTITKEATEEEAGVKTYTCTVCGETRTEEIPALEHTHKFIEKVVEPTCTEGGYTVHTCKCGETYKDNEKPALGHSYTSKVTKEATCKEEGERIYTCERCGDSYTEKIEKTKDHTWDEVVVTKEATEEEAGIKTYTCSVCGETKTEEIPVLEHTHKFTEEVVEPTCTEGGYTVHTCKCGETYKDNEKPALGHTWNEDYTVDKKATCAEEGSESIHCSICNVVKEGSQRPIEKTAHNYGEWKIVKQATKTSEGLKERTCQNCGDKVTDKIPKIKDSSDSGDSGALPPGKPALVKDIVKQITTAKKDTDLQGSTFSLLQAKGVAKSKTSVKISWKKVAGAKAYIVYGNKCGGNNKFKKLMTTTGTSFTHKKLKRGTYYKYIIIAVNGDKVLAISKTIHVTAKGGKFGNTKSITIKPKKSLISLAKNKTYKINAKAVARNKNLKVKTHRSIAFESSNQKVATVSAKGVIKAVGKGTCYVFVYAQNGVSKKVKIVVK